MSKECQKLRRRTCIFVHLRTCGPSIGGDAHRANGFPGDDGGDGAGAAGGDGGSAGRADRGGGAGGRPGAHDQEWSPVGDAAAGRDAGDRGPAVSRDVQRAGAAGPRLRSAVPDGAVPLRVLHGVQGARERGSCQTAKNRVARFTVGRRETPTWRARRASCSCWTTSTRTPGTTTRAGSGSGRRTGSCTWRWGTAAPTRRRRRTWGRSTARCCGWSPGAGCRSTIRTSGCSGCGARSTRWGCAIRGAAGSTPTGGCSAPTWGRRCTKRWTGSWRAGTTGGRSWRGTSAGRRTRSSCGRCTPTGTMRAAARASRAASSGRRRISRGTTSRATSLRTTSTAGCAGRCWRRTG